MSTTQLLVLGALAGFTIFLGLPIGRIKSASTAAEGRAERDGDGNPALPALGRARPRHRARRGGSDVGNRRRRLVGRLRPARRDVRSRRHDRPDEPRLLRPVVRPPAQQGDARPGRSVGGGVRALVGGRPLARRLARAADRDGHRAAQLLRGARDRAVRGPGPGHARARPDHRLRPPQRDRGLRHRRAALGLRDAAHVEVPRSCWG